MRFSIIIPFFNEIEKIDKLLESLININYDLEDYEVIFIDNNSNDGTADSIRASGFFVEKAYGVASSYYARNVGVSVADGEYLLFIDADCIVDSLILKEYDACIKLSNGNSIFAGAIKANVESGSSFERYAYKNKILNQKSAATGWAYRPFAQTANALFNKNMLLAVRGFNPDMTSGGDAEVCWRILDKFGAEVVFAENAVVFHQHRKDASSFSEQFKKYGRGRIQQIVNYEAFAQNKKTEDVLLSIKRALELHDLLEKNIPNNEEIIEKSIDVIKDISYASGFLFELNKMLGADYPDGTYVNYRNALRKVN